MRKNSNLKGDLISEEIVISIHSCDIVIIIPPSFWNCTSLIEIVLRVESRKIIKKLA